MQIQKATSNEHNLLTEITKKSKAFWGYSEEQMSLWDEALTITEEYFESNKIYKLTENNIIIGYYSFFEESENVIKLDNMFLLPKYIGKGFGKIMMNDFIERISRKGAIRIVLESEPNSEIFYQKLGFKKVGQIETSIKNRFLPIMEMNL